MADDFEHDHEIFSSAAATPIRAAVTPPTESLVSPALAALTRPPKVGDVIEHDGNDVTIIGTQIRGPGDFSVIIDGGATLHSR